MLTALAVYSLLRFPPYPSTGLRMHPRVAMLVLLTAGTVDVMAVMVAVLSCCA